MDDCIYSATVVACFSDALVFVCSLLLFFVAVRPMQAIQARKRLFTSSTALTGKSFVFYSVFLENLLLVVEFWLTGKPSSVIHLLHDSTKFALYSAVLYYFAIQSFSIKGGSSTAKAILWTIGTTCGLYVSACSAYLVYDLEEDTSGTSACKGAFHLGYIWLTLCLGDCAMSLILIGVGLFARHLIQAHSSGKVFRRERKLWVVIWVLLVTSFLELGYDLFGMIARPNKYCVGLFPVCRM